MVARTALHVPTLVVSAGLLSSCLAQHKQSIFLTEHFTNLNSEMGATHRTNVCGIQRDIEAGTKVMKTALQGLQIAVSLPVVTEPGFMNWESASPFVIDAENPGLMGRVMDELAERAGFSYRDSFHVFPGPPEGWTYTEALAALVEQIDITAEYWIHLPERLALGITFPEGFYDTSLQIVGVQKSSDTGFDVLSWKMPFTDPVWGLIVAAMLFSSGVFWILERLEEDGDLGESETHSHSLSVSLFLTTASFTGGGGYTPRTSAGRLFTISWTFTCLLLTAAYTANLASFLVVSKTPSFEVRSMHEANDAQVPVCVYKGTAEEVMARETFATANYKPMNQLDMFQSLHSMAAGGPGCTVAVTTWDSWKAYQRNEQVNGNCTLEAIGGRFRISQAGVAVKSDSGRLCTSLIRDVLDIHMKDMKSDGTLDKIKEEYFMKNAQVSCAANDDGLSNMPLGVESMGSTFLLHFVFSVVALALATGHHFHVARTGQNQTAASAEPTEREEAAEGRAAAESKRSVSKLVPPWEGGKEGGREGESKAEATLAVLLAQVQRLGERQMRMEERMEKVLDRLDHPPQPLGATHSREPASPGRQGGSNSDRRGSERASQGSQHPPLATLESFTTQFCV